MSMRSEDAKIIELWLGSQASPLTQDCYRRDADRLLAHVRKPLRNIGLADLQAFAQSLVVAGLAPITRARTIAAIRSLFSFAVRMRYLAINPAAELSLPSYERRLAERVLSEEDVKSMLAAEANLRDRILLKLLYLAGLRVSEACSVRWRNLHTRGDAGQVTVFGKGGRTRAIALPAQLWNELVGVRGKAGGEAPVFRSRGGRPLDRGRVGAWCAVLRRRPGWTPALAPTGSGTRTPATRSTAGGLPSTWFKPPSGTPALRPLPPTCTPVQATPVRAFSPPKELQQNVANPTCVWLAPE